ncbi:protein of unknown function (plasmid) [Cupriavidus taiwanensis]|uniref:Uncharacterized protein n=1 Tax=Cupriavidus taiwanensis TaxID=164546 RepID=A0A375IPP3_9BURK|nr:protein of unknown function [Cupriavidus taiwanensis]
MREAAIALLQAQRRAQETTRAVGQQRRYLRIAYVSAALYLALPARAADAVRRTVCAAGSDHQ